MEDSQFEALREFFSSRPELGVTSVYLFGSHAENRAHRESDVDIAVLLDWKRYPTDRDRFDARVSLGSQLIGVLHHNEIDLVILNDVPPLFGRHILHTGVPVFVGDPQTDEEFFRVLQLRAADLEPWLRKVRRLRLEALAR
ncbi:MAG TPA: nucleotidyltransferase domain-containing protein [Thermoanaerobaculia bacterium]|nr:nucleotidyltransferase domain-containing protein [Thermoanaerobaculia bacterium]